VTTTPAAAAAPHRHPLATAVSRGVALFLGVFSLLNLVIQFRTPGYDANLWWIDFGPIARAVPLLGSVAILFLGVIWLCYAFAPDMGRARRRVTRTSCELLWLVIAYDIVSYYGLVLHGVIHTPVAVPMVLSVGIALWAIWKGAASQRPAHGPLAWGVMGVTVVVGAVIFPLLQMVCFGLTDYRPSAKYPADVALVFGAKVNANGHPSDALADRTHVAIELYKNKLVSKLIFSGGPGPGIVEEPDAMRDMALKAGIPREDILLDNRGVNTDATVRNLDDVFAHLRQDPAYDRPLKMLAISHFYHLPRIKMCCGAAGYAVLTVPVREPLSGTPKFMLREVAALWKYYLEALLG
jgi:vancomycin permeability regulator SanA